MAQTLAEGQVGSSAKPAELPLGLCCQRTSHENTTRNTREQNIHTEQEAQQRKLCWNKPYYEQGRFYHLYALQVRILLPQGTQGKSHLGSSDCLYLPTI